MSQDARCVQGLGSRCKGSAAPPDQLCLSWQHRTLITLCRLVLPCMALHSMFPIRSCLRAWKAAANALLPTWHIRFFGFMVSPHAQCIAGVQVLNSSLALLSGAGKSLLGMDLSGATAQLRRMDAECRCPLEMLRCVNEADRCLADSVSRLRRVKYFS